jgi:hypothetical protein
MPLTTAGHSEVGQQPVDTAKSQSPAPGDTHISLSLSWSTAWFRLAGSSITFATTTIQIAAAASALIDFVATRRTWRQ